MLAGGSYLDVAARFGVSHPTVYAIMWEVIDADTSRLPNVCRSVRGEVTYGVVLIPQQHVTAAAAAQGVEMQVVQRRVEAIELFSEGNGTLLI